MLYYLSASLDSWLIDLSLTESSPALSHSSFIRLQAKWRRASKQVTVVVKQVDLYLADRRGSSASGHKTPQLLAALQDLLAACRTAGKPKCRNNYGKIAADLFRRLSDYNAN